MGIVFRQSIKTTLVTFAGALLGALIIYLSSSYIPAQGLGFLRNLTSQAVVFSQVILFGLHITLMVFIHKYPPGDPRRKVLITLTLGIPLLIMALVTLIYFIFRDQIIPLYRPEDIYFVERYFAWLPVYIFLWGYMTILEQFLTSQLKVALSSFMREILLRVVNILLIVLFATESIGFDLFIAGSVLANGVPALALYLLARKTEGFGLSFNWKVFTKPELKDITQFAWYHSLLTVSMVVMENLELIMLPPLAATGLVAAAIYSNAAYITTVARIPARAMATATFPIITKAYEAGDHKHVADLFHRSGLNILLASTLMFLLIALNMHNVVAILPAGVREQYAPMTALVAILLIGRFVDISTGLNNELMSISTLYKFNFRITAVLVLVMVGVNYYLIPRYGIYGAAWGTTISVSSFNLLKMLVLWRKLKLQPFTSRSGLVLLAGLVAGLAGYFLPYVHDPFTDTAVRSIVIVITYGLMVLWLKPSADLETYIRSVRSDKRLF